MVWPCKKDERVENTGKVVGVEDARVKTERTLRSMGGGRGVGNCAEDG